MGSGGITQTKQKEERDCNDEALALLNQPKLLMNLWRALKSALDTEFKASKKSIKRMKRLHYIPKPIMLG